MLARSPIAITRVGAAGEGASAARTAVGAQVTGQNDGLWPPGVNLTGIPHYIRVRNREWTERAFGTNPPDRVPTMALLSRTRAVSET